MPAVNMKSSAEGISPPRVALHRYACVGCRQRKVKCDHVLTGCAQCRKANLSCIYLSRRGRGDDQARPVHSILPRTGLLDESAHPATPSIVSIPLVNNDLGNTQDEDSILPLEIRDASYESTAAVSDQGRLFIAPGKSRYFNNRKMDEIASLEKILSNVDCQAKPRFLQPPATSSDSLAGLYSSTLSVPLKDLRSCHPTPEQMHVLWDYYAQHVDVCVKILYKPAAQSLVFRSSTQTQNITASDNAFLFAIWLAATTAMSEDECQKLHGEARHVLLPRYEQYLQQALLQASWITTQETVVLQAIILLLVCSAGRQSRSAWMLSGAALSIAQAMGIHRDGTAFSLSLIDTEVRRRIWWTLCLLDNRISEDCGLDTHIPINTNAALPLHINDADLVSQSHLENPAPRTEFCEMTLALIKLEMIRTAHKIRSMRPEQHFQGTNTEIEALVRDQVHRYEHVYLNYLDPMQPQHRLGILGIRFISAKLWKTVHDILQQNDIDSRQSDIELELLSCNAQILEIAHQLPDRFSPYGWFFQCKYTQWHALAYLIVGLSRCKHLSSPVINQAWHAIDTVINDAAGNGISEDASPARSSTDKSPSWQPLQVLLARARQARLNSNPITYTSPAQDPQFNALLPTAGYQMEELQLVEPNLDTLSPVYEAMLTEENLFSSLTLWPSLGDLTEND